MLKYRHFAPLFVLVLATSASAQTSVTLSPVFVSGGNSGTGSYSLSSDSASVSADASGGSTNSASASLNADWIINVRFLDVNHQDNDTATITEGSYSFSRSEYAAAYALNTPDQGSAWGDATNGAQYAYAAVSGNDYDYDVPPTVVTPMSGSLTDITLTYNSMFGYYIGNKTVFSSSLAANGYLMHPYPTEKDDAGQGFAHTSVSTLDDYSKIVVTHHQP